jgi:transposase-like protein
MSKQTRRKFTSAFKAKVALEAIKNQETLAELSKKFDVSPVVISKWKSELLEKLPGIFDRPGSGSDEAEAATEKLYAQIGQLKVENDFLKKASAKLGIKG